MRATRADGVEVELNDDGTWKRSEPTTIERETTKVSSTSNSAGSGFRGVPWGSTNAAATLREGRDPDVHENDLSVWNDVGLASLTWSVFYAFIDDRLARGTYVLAAEFQNMNRYLVEFQNVLDLLVQNYGEPSQKDDVWFADTYQDTPGEWGMAVSVGDYARYAKWTFDESEMMLTVRGEDFNITLAIAYSSHELSAEEERRQNIRDLSDL